MDEMQAPKIHRNSRERGAQENGSEWGIWMSRIEREVNKVACSKN